MLRIKCPWCGERSEREFFYGGDATVTRPAAPEMATSQDWLEYVYFRDNPRGPHLEYWLHRAGCRRWFKALRNTSTNEFIMTGDVDLQPAGGEK
ncbi:MAG: sarcosine oxidase (alpha subunit) oxidoreductase protein [uncultured bacterium]|nr:MAG: sarcosine oxidase (alpha subunit) oxidoreductase protein [uncultured bacterium]